MNSRMRLGAATITKAALPILLMTLALNAADAVDVPKVTTLRTPENGIQPQAAVDAQGVVHLIRSKSETRPRSYLP